MAIVIPPILAAAPTVSSDTPSCRFRGDLHEDAKTRRRGEEGGEKTGEEEEKIGEEEGKSREEEEKSWEGEEKIGRGGEGVGGVWVFWVCLLCGAVGWLLGCDDPSARVAARSDQRSRAALRPPGPEHAIVVPSQRFAALLLCCVAVFRHAAIFTTLTVSAPAVPPMTTVKIGLS
ncbi:MAG: hypothetical protein ACK5ZN_12365 [Phycisphaerales bacterium]